MSHESRRDKQVRENNLLDNLKEKVQRLNKLIELGAPHVILATEVMLLFESATLLFGEEIYRKMAEWAIDNARRRHGLCSSCGVPINPQTTFAPLCEHCEAVNEAEYQRIEREYPDDGERI